MSSMSRWKCSACFGRIMVLSRSAPSFVAPGRLQRWRCKLDAIECRNLMPVQDARDEPADLNPGEPRSCGLQILLVTLGGGQLIAQPQDLILRLMCLTLGALCPSLHTGDPVAKSLDHCPKSPELFG